MKEEVIKAKLQEYQRELQLAEFDYQEILAKRSHLRRMIKLCEDELAGQERLPLDEKGAAPTEA